MLKSFLPSLRLIITRSTTMCPYISHTAADTLKICIHFTAEWERQRQTDRREWESVSLPQSASLWFCSFGFAAGVCPMACHPLHYSKCIYTTAVRPGGSLRWLKHLPDWQWWNIKNILKKDYLVGWWSETHADICSRHSRTATTNWSRSM